MTVWSGRIDGRPTSKKNGRRWVRTPSGRKLIPSAAYITYHANAAAQLAGNLPSNPIIGPVELIVTIHLRTRQSEPDLDNLVVGISDLVEDIGVILNDRQVVRIEAEKRYGADAFAADVTVATVEMVAIAAA